MQQQKQIPKPTILVYDQSFQFQWDCQDHRSNQNLFAQTGPGSLHECLSFLYEQPKLAFRLYLSFEEYEWNWENWKSQTWPLHQENFSIAFYVTPWCSHHVCEFLLKTIRDPSVRVTVPFLQTFWQYIELIPAEGELMKGPLILVLLFSFFSAIIIFPDIIQTLNWV